LNLEEDPMGTVESRRLFIVASGVGAANVLLGCKGGVTVAQAADKGSPTRAGARSEATGGDEPEVTATEDLMREHGVIRRMIVVYREAAARFRTKPSTVPLDALQRAAKLFRSFGEDYHERQLEEAHIFPMLKRAGGPASAAVDTLIVQHNRGREITDFVTAATGSPVSTARADSVAATLEAFARMYEEHAALEDTLVFPAWKRTMSAKQLDEIGDLFEDIEHKTFGKDGFDDAVDQVAAIEHAFGLDLAQFTAPPPPRL
jgi:hemerythrin-like domain-containing protein